jgi:glucose-1-phosphate cytidylyltransferase
VLCLGYKGDQIKDYFLNFEAHQSDVTVELGKHGSVTCHGDLAETGWNVTLVNTGTHAQTGARVKRAARYVEGDRFMLTYGDGVADIDIAALLAFHERAGTIGTVTGVRPSSRFGELLTDGPKVVSFSEKPRTHTGLINGGFFVFERRFFDYLDDHDGCILERDPLERLARDGQLSVYHHDGYWQCMDTQKDVQHLNQLWEKGDAPWKVWA